MLFCLATISLVLALPSCVLVLHACFRMQAEDENIDICTLLFVLPDTLENSNRDVLRSEKVVEAGNDTLKFACLGLAMIGGRP